MVSKRNKNTKKQSDLSNWIMPSRFNCISKRNELKNEEVQVEKPKLAFGHGYNPHTILNGILKFSFSHIIEKDLKLYEFEPKLSYKIFTTLAKILKYKCTGLELQNERTVIKNTYFITNKDPKVIINELNSAISEIFKTYDPV